MIICYIFAHYLVVLFKDILLKRANFEFQNESVNLLLKCIGSSGLLFSLNIANCIVSIWDEIDYLCSKTV